MGLHALLLLSAPVSLLSLICTQCPLRMEPPHSSSCIDTCEGDICYIIVTKDFNGTLIAGCLSATGNLVHNGTAVCHRKETSVLCACTSEDKCNNPKAPLSTFEFSEEEILEGQQIFPQIQPTEPSVDSNEDHVEVREPLKAPTADEGSKGMAKNSSVNVQEEKVTQPMTSTTTIEISRASSNVSQTKNTRRFDILLLATTTLIVFIK